MENRKFLKWKISSGLSLIEILVVVTIFAILGVIVTRAIILTLQGSQKSTSLVAVRENLDYSMSIIERQIRNANSVDCVNSSGTNLIYTDQYQNPSSFTCNGTSVASGSATLTSSAVSVQCSFSCVIPSDSTTQPYVVVSLTGKPTGVTGIQSSTVTTNTRIYLRDY